MNVSVRSIGRAWMLPLLAALLSPTALATPAHADNNRLNISVVKMVYIVQHQAGCTNIVQTNPQLQLAAQWHALDVRNNRALNGDTGSDGSSPQDRANAAGYRGQVQETVAINPALSVTSFEVINMWYHRPEILAIMQNCANTEVGVWSENSLDRTVLVAVYGQPAPT